MKLSSCWFAALEVQTFRIGLDIPHLIEQFGNGKIILAFRCLRFVVVLA